MDAITTPTGAYATPPTGQLPPNCPQCGGRLGHFLQTAETVPQAPPPMPPLPQLLRSFGSPVPAPAPVAARPQLFTAVNNPGTPGQFTLFIMLHGQDWQRHRRCVRSIAATAAITRLKLRAICNSVSPNTMALLRDIPVEHVYAKTPPPPKYQAMRDVFNDPARPIDTNWVIWLDDAAYLKRSDWLDVLAGIISDQDPDERVGAIGHKVSHRLPASPRGDPRDWFRHSPWFHNQHFRTLRGAEAPNGDCVHYLLPNFFAISREAIRTCDIPDTRLQQRGGGIVIGEQLHQNGFKLKAFDTNNSYVHDAQQPNPRSEPYPWQG